MGENEAQACDVVRRVLCRICARSPVLDVGCILTPRCQLGVFIYTFAGTGATLAYNLGNIAGLSGVGCRLPVIIFALHP